jgi:hypothetical protein
MPAAIASPVEVHPSEFEEYTSKMDGGSAPYAVLGLIAPKLRTANIIRLR